MYVCFCVPAEREKSQSERKRERDRSEGARDFVHVVGLHRLGETACLCLCVRVHFLLMTASLCTVVTFGIWRESCRCKHDTASCSTRQR